MESLAETLVLQPEYMWIAQLEQSADVAAQAAAIAGLTTFRWVLVPAVLLRFLLIDCSTDLCGLDHEETSDMSFAAGLC